MASGEFSALEQKVDELIDLMNDIFGLYARLENEAAAAGLPKGAVDLILLVDAYHEFSYPREMGEAMVRALKPGGRMVLIEYRGEDMSIPIKPLHKMTEQQVIAEMLALGLEWERTEDFLPQQHFLVFRLPLDQPAENPASD